MLLADWSGTPERELLSGEAREILEEGLALLPDHYRAILVLRDVEELSNEEVAEALGESVASVKSRLHRARMALREVLTRRLGPGGHASGGAAAPCAVPLDGRTADRPGARRRRPRPRPTPAISPGVSGATRSSSKRRARRSSSC